MRWPTILVMGAGGFIGGWITEAFCLAGATDLRAGVRRLNNTARFTRLPTKIIHCDIMDHASLDAAMSGADVVINCVRHAESGIFADGQRNLLKIAAQRGVKKLIYMSSVAIYGAAAGMVSEDTPPLPPVSPYGKDKLISEQLCEAAAGPKLTISVLRPSLVYGPFGEEWTLRFMKGIISGRLKRLGVAGEGKANLIFASDLAKFATHLVQKNDLPHFTVYNANGTEIPPFNEYFDRLSRALGRGPLQQDHESRIQSAARRQVRRVSRVAMRKTANLLAKSGQSDSRIRRLLTQGAERLSPGPEEGNYGMKVVYSALRAKSIGFEARTPLEDGVVASVEWAKRTGLIE